MKYLAILAVILFAAKKIAEFVFVTFCILVFGYGIGVLVRDGVRGLRRSQPTAKTRVA